MKDILLLGKKILFEQSPILLEYQPDENWREYWLPKSGTWYYRDGYLFGEERGNFGGILLSKESYTEDVMFSFTIGTELPATRDVNAVFCARWNEKTDYIGASYVCGLNGWYEDKSGIERILDSDKESGDQRGVYSTTAAFRYQPGTEVRMTAGSIQGHTFMVVDDVLVTELIDPNPLLDGQVGFSAYCTRLKIKDMEIRKIIWEDFPQQYEPEF